MSRSFTRDRRGGAAVEFAFVLPVFVILLLAGAFFGQAFYSIGSVQWAIERTARDLMLDNTLSTAEFEARVRELTAGLTPLDYQVTYAETIYGEIRVTEVTTILRYTMDLPVYGPLVVSYPVEVQIPRPVS